MKKTITLTFTYPEGQEKPDLDISSEGFDDDPYEVTMHIFSVADALAAEYGL